MRDCTDFKLIVQLWCVLLAVRLQWLSGSDHTHIHVQVHSWEGGYMTCHNLRRCGMCSGLHKQRVIRGFKGEVKQYFQSPHGRGVGQAVLPILWLLVSAAEHDAGNSLALHIDVILAMLHLPSGLRENIHFPDSHSTELGRLQGEGLCTELHTPTGHTASPCLPGCAGCRCWHR